MQECILVLTLSLWYQKISLKSIAKELFELSLPILKEINNIFFICC